MELTKNFIAAGGNTLEYSGPSHETPSRSLLPDLHVRTAIRDIIGFQVKRLRVRQRSQLSETLPQPLDVM